MEKIVVGFLGCGNIGCGVYKLLETYGAQIEENEGVGFEVRKILVRSLNKKPRMGDSCGAADGSPGGCIG